MFDRAGHSVTVAEFEHESVCRLRAGVTGCCQTGMIPMVAVSFLTYNFSCWIGCWTFNFELLYSMYMYTYKCKLYQPPKMLTSSVFKRKMHCWLLQSQNSKAMSVLVWGEANSFFDTFKHLG